MLIPRRRLLTLACEATLLVLGSSGCAARSPYMNMVSGRRPLVADPNTATVVFVRPHDTFAGQVVTIVDDQRRFVGDSLAKTYFAASIAPGPHLFFSLARNTDVLLAGLLPGHVYFVEVSLDVETGGSGPVASLSAITPRLAVWSKLEAWLAESHQLALAPASGTLEGTTRYPDLEERLTRKTSAITTAPPPELQARSLRPEDGL